ncbi:MAG: PilW family protein [Gammaproteobacteria bacterium]|nr:PilW family protein [Gammaproteobacteria bacterium]
MSLSVSSSRIVVTPRYLFSTQTTQQGFGLVEVLIALVLGMVLSIGMANVFISSKQAYRTQDALSGVQQNGRYAMEVLTRNIRMAGYQGCANLEIVEPHVIANNMPGSGVFNFEEAVHGYAVDNNGAFKPAYSGTKPGQADPGRIVNGTDMISVSRADDCGAYLVGNMLADNANIQLNPDNTCNFAAGDLVLISDCKTSDLFRATSVANGAKMTIAHANNMNSSNRLSKPYGSDAQVFRYTQSDYYIGTNAFNEPALYVRVNGGAATELVEGVEDMQFDYGEDTTSDRSVDRYSVEHADVAAAGDTVVASWGNVYSARLALTLRSQSRNITLQNSDPKNPANADKRMRQAMTATVGLRNKLP